MLGFGGLNNTFFDFHTIKNNLAKINIEWTALFDFLCGSDHCAGQNLYYPYVSGHSALHSAVRKCHKWSYF